MKLNLFITGSKGLFGNILVNFLKKKKINFQIFKRKKNIHYNQNYFEEIFKLHDFTHIINLAAYTNVDNSEKNKKHVKELNINFLEHICKAIKKSQKDIKLIQFSTDQMYYDYKLNNEKNKKVVNYYTKSKIKSEEISKDINSLILRTNFFGKSLSKNRISFSDWIYKSLKKKQKIFLAEDLYFSPLSMNTLSKIIFRILQSKKTGVYNLGSIEGKSRYEFGVEFSKILNLNLNYIVKVKMKELKLSAKRNNDMRMNIKKFERDFKIKLPSLKKEIIKESKNYEK